MSLSKAQLEEKFEKDDIHKRQVEKDVRNRLFHRILNEETFSKHVDLSSEISKEEYFISIYTNLYGFIQLQARICNVETIEANRDCRGPSLVVHYSNSHVMSINNWEESKVEINLDERTWGTDETTEEEAEKFSLHLDNLCYALEQLEEN